MRRFARVLLGLMLGLMAAVTPVQAIEPMPPETELVEVYEKLLENHLSKPSPQQLVQGALKQVSQQAALTKRVQLAVSSDDDTLAELKLRLREWLSATGVDWKTINTWAIGGMLAALHDPHTAFFTKEQLRRFQEGVENQLVGFGFRLRQQGDQLLIREIVPDSPAAASDLQPGDQLLAIDGVSLKGKSFEEAYGMLKGEEGSEAVLAIYRPQLKQEKSIRLKRAYLSIPEAEGKRFADGIGYISLETFGSDAPSQFRDLLTQFSQGPQPLQGLVIDLRDNGGGYLGSARDIASLFMENGLLMYTINRNGVELETWVRNGRSVSYPVRILVNGATASASELLAGALRDHGIAKLVGTKTYGKGSAQQIIPLLDGDALKITLHEYFTPKHTVVNHVGLQPDIEEEDELAQVVEALKSLGVKRFELRASGDETMINGVSFFALEPLFKQEPQGVAIRSAVLASLLGDEAVPDKGYSLLQPFLEQNKGIAYTRTHNNEMILTFTGK
jgi:carboxyl-terminal processing protease